MITLLDLRLVEVIMIFHRRHHQHSCRLSSSQSPDTTWLKAKMKTLLHHQPVCGHQRMRAHNHTSWVVSAMNSSFGVVRSRLVSFAAVFRDGERCVTSRKTAAKETRSRQEWIR